MYLLEKAPGLLNVSVSDVWIWQNMHHRIMAICVQYHATNDFGEIAHWVLII